LNHCPADCNCRAAIENLKANIGDLYDEYNRLKKMVGDAYHSIERLEDMISATDRTITDVEQMTDTPNHKNTGASGGKSSQVALLDPHNVRCVSTIPSGGIATRLEPPKNPLRIVEPNRIDSDIEVLTDRLQRTRFQGRPAARDLRRWLPDTDDVIVGLPRGRYSFRITHSPEGGGTWEFYPGPSNWQDIEQQGSDDTHSDHCANNCSCRYDIQLLEEVMELRMDRLTSRVTKLAEGLQENAGLPQDQQTLQ
jgi:hypothetical protein